MNKLKIGVSIAPVALLAAAAALPAFASSDYELHGNGSDSRNRIQVEMSHRMSVFQHNDTDIDNTVTVHNDTGNNSVSGSTGGNVELTTGDATSEINIENVAGFNHAEIESCGCEHGVNIGIHGNGSDSHNDVSFESSHETEVAQVNNTDIDNNVEVHNSTGNNEADNNTGSGYHGGYGFDDYKHDKRGEMRHEWKEKKDDLRHQYSKKLSFNDWMSMHHNKLYDDWNKHYNHHSTNGGNNGDVSIDTGNASSEVTISNMAGFNWLSM